MVSRGHYIIGTSQLIHSQHFGPDLLFIFGQTATITGAYESTYLHTTHHYLPSHNLQHLRNLPRDKLVHEMCRMQAVEPDVPVDGGATLLVPGIPLRRAAGVGGAVARRVLEAVFLWPVKDVVEDLRGGENLGPDARVSLLERADAGAEEGVV
jgi:hypothetical protein